MTPLAIVIMAAGKGTRMKSEKAKVLHELCGKPMIAYPVRLACALRARRIVVVVGHQAPQVEQAVTAEFPRARLQFALQAEQHGTAHAVLQARKALRGFAGEVLILSGDVPLLGIETIRRFRRHHRLTKSALSVLTTRPADPAHYGRCLIDDRRRLTRIVEYRDATAAERALGEINTGIYLIDATLLWWALDRIGTENDQHEMYLTDAIALANGAGRLVTALEEPDFLSVMGVNSRVELAAAARVIRGQINESLMKEGVTMIDPVATYLDLDVKVRRDTLIEPGVFATGKTRIGAGCLLGLGSRLHNATIGDGAVVAPHAVLDGVQVKAGETVS